MSNGQLSAPVVSKLPLGLIGLLGIKSGGAYPQNLANHLQPVIPEIMRWLGVAHRELVSDTAVPITVAGTPGFNPSALVVPQGQFWYLDHLGSTITTDAAETYVGYVGVLTQPGAIYVISDRMTPGVSSQWSGGIERYLPQFLAPGDTLGFMCDVATGLPFATPGSLRAMILRMPI